MYNAHLRSESLILTDVNGFHQILYRISMDRNGVRPSD